jgi:hypothetical protein
MSGGPYQAKEARTGAGAESDLAFTGSVGGLCSAPHHCLIQLGMAFGTFRLLVGAQEFPNLMFGAGVADHPESDGFRDEGTCSGESGFDVFGFGLDFSAVRY